MYAYQDRIRAVELYIKLASASGQSDGIWVLISTPTAETITAGLAGYRE